MIELITQIQGGRVFVDGSKDPDRLSHLQRRLTNRIKVIRLMRDGRGVANSYMKHYGVSMRLAVEEWLSTEKACDRAVSQFAAEDVLVVRYESLCEDPEETLASVLKFGELETSPQRRHKIPSELHILGNNMRLSGLGSIELDEKWRQELKPQDLEMFAEIAGAPNRENGYQ